MDFDTHFAREVAKQLFLGFTGNLPTVSGTTRIPINLETEAGWVMEFALASRFPDVNVVHRDDKELLLWTVHEALRNGSPHVSWEMLINFPGEFSPGQRHKSIYESALRICSPLVLYRIGYRTLGQLGMGTHGGSFYIVDSRTTRVGRWRKQDTRTASADRTKSDGNFHSEVAFEFHERFLNMAKCGLELYSSKEKRCGELVTFPSPSRVETETVQEKR